MKVEELSQYGKTLSGLPNEAIERQRAIVLTELRKKFGLVGLLPFFIKLIVGQRALKKEYPDAYQRTVKVGTNAAKELPMMITMFNIIKEREGREQAYEFVQSIFQKVAIRSMPALYQIDDLVKCDGDVFDNFVKFNIAWFRAMDEQGTWKVKEIKRDKDTLAIIVSECANCVLGEAFDCPEIAKLGCDHDLAGFPVIVDRVNAVFRRPHTIAKGDDYCDFMFYRKGTAPETELPNK